jgi:hypothetical protein
LGLEHIEALPVAGVENSRRDDRRLIISLPKARCYSVSQGNCAVFKKGRI